MEFSNQTTSCQPLEPWVWCMIWAGKFLCMSLIPPCLSIVKSRVNTEVSSSSRPRQRDVCCSGYSLFTPRKPHSPLNINGERSFLEVNRLQYQRPHHYSPYSLQGSIVILLSFTARSLKTPHSPLILVEEGDILWWLIEGNSTKMYNKGRYIPMSNLC